ncbi:MAG: leucyl/phenylalanyl-tRNA--protein transferase [Tepidisphaeraceae bacterium]
MQSATLEPETLLTAYSQGAFPMTDRDGTTRWYTADPRGILPLDRFHVPQSLRSAVNRSPDCGGFEIRIDHDFERVMRACMVNRRDGTWISEKLIAAYLALHRQGFAHSVEAWQNNELAGGLYGVSIGAAFFGESMFHNKRDASKVALVHLVRRLQQRNYDLLDAQASTPHLVRFGCVEISAADYLQRLRGALSRRCAFK